MSNLIKLEFATLDLAGKNYMSWVLDAKIHLNAKGLGETIMRENNASSQYKAKTMIFIRHHLDEELKTEYITVEDPLELWDNLRERYDNLRTGILPKARYERIHLRLQDFKTVSEFNSIVFNISYKLRLCGEPFDDKDLLEKTFFTFHPSNLLLQQQYREKGFIQYSQLISCLLVAEINNEFLLKNYKSRPTGSAPLPEANAAVHNYPRKRWLWYGRGRGHGRGRGNYSYNHLGSPSGNKKNNHESKQRKGKFAQNDHQKGSENPCFRYGLKGHWTRTFRTPDHFVKLYQASIKGKRKNVEANFADNDDIHDFDNPNYDIEVNMALMDDDLDSIAGITHLDTADFLMTDEL